MNEYERSNSLATHVQHTWLGSHTAHMARASKALIIAWLGVTTLIYTFGIFFIYTQGQQSSCSALIVGCAQGFNSTGRDTNTTQLISLNLQSTFWFPGSLLFIPAIWAQYRFLKEQPPSDWAPQQHDVTEWALDQSSKLAIAIPMLCVVINSIYSVYFYVYFVALGDGIGYALGRHPAFSQSEI